MILNHENILENEIILEVIILKEMLDVYRNEIDSINNQILSLLSRRGELSKKIGEEKEDKNLQIYDPQREKAMMRNLLQKNKGPLSLSLIHI